MNPTKLRWSNHLNLLIIYYIFLSLNLTINSIFLILLEENNDHNINYSPENLRMYKCCKCVKCENKFL